MMPQANLVRAIGSEFISRKFRSTVFVLGIFAFVIIAAVIWLTTLSGWWWLLAVPIIMFMLLGLFTALMVRAMLKKLRPELTKPQANEVNSFVDKLERVADNLQTPMFIIVFRVIRDIMRPRGSTFIRTVTEDSTTLRKDLLQLQKNFK